MLQCQPRRYPSLLSRPSRRVPPMAPRSPSTLRLAGPTPKPGYVSRYPMAGAARPRTTLSARRGVSSGVPGITGGAKGDGVREGGHWGGSHDRGARATSAVVFNASGANTGQSSELGATKISPIVVGEGKKKPVKALIRNGFPCWCPGEDLNLHERNAH
jgi:hypothetical protein